MPKLQRHLWPVYEPQLVQNCRDSWIAQALIQETIGDPQLICRALLRAAFALAYEKLDAPAADELLDTAVRELLRARGRR